MIRLFWSMLLAAHLLAILACASIGGPPQDFDLAGRYYRVKPKDTLSEISQKYQVSVDEIMDINGIEDERALRVGQALYLPDSDVIGLKIARLRPKRPAKRPKNNRSPIQQSPALSPLNEPKKFEKIAKTQKTFRFPVPGGRVIHRYSRNKVNPYDGIGIEAPMGTKVIAAQAGRVLFTGNDGTKFGLLVIVEHRAPFITVYTHLKKSMVKRGQLLKSGQPLGSVGKTGGADSPHLHFQIRVDRRPQDPMRYLIDQR